MKLSVIVPAVGQAQDSAALVRRIGTACAGIDAEIILVGNPGDATPAAIARSGAHAGLPVRHLLWSDADGGLDGAVVDGIAMSRATYCLVIGGDLEHLPELIPILVARLESGDVDLTIASRYCGTGEFGGSPGPSRSLRSRAAALAARALFPGRLRDCTDLMTAFFAIRRTAIDPGLIRRGNPSVLLEILLRHRLRVEEIPLEFGRSAAGHSKPTLAQGMRFMRQLGELRVGRAGLFAGVGAVGTVLNLLIMAALLAFDVHYVVAAMVAAEVTILTNFFLQEKLVFAGDTRTARTLRHRFAQSFGFNNVEAVLRVPFLLLLVEILMFNSVIAQAGTLACAFVVRYLFHAKVVYRRQPADAATSDSKSLDAVAAAPAVVEELHAPVELDLPVGRDPRAGRTVPPAHRTAESDRDLARASPRILR